MIDLRRGLEAALLKEYEEMSGYPSVEAMLSYTLPNSDDPTDYDKWALGTERCLHANSAMLQEWERANCEV